MLALGTQLRNSSYRFTTTTPATHERVVARCIGRASSLHDVFGWSRPFRTADLPTQMVSLLKEADEIEISENCFRSKVRFSTLEGKIFVHSGFPTDAADSVFFGPDTYRFARVVKHCIMNMGTAEVRRILDIGCGSGAGGLYAAGLLNSASVNVVLSDINLKALRYSAVNAELNEASNVTIRKSDLFNGLEGRADLIISNPPYLMDENLRLYRHGGDALGSDLSRRIVQAGIDRIAPGGRLLLYTGAAVVGGEDQFIASIGPWLRNRKILFEYEEVDPDVFGEELERNSYRDVDRIAAVALTVFA